MEKPNTTGAHFVDELAKLEARLIEVKLNYDAAGDAVDDPDARDRFAAHQSLFAVLEFIDSFPPWQDARLSFALQRLLVALTNIHEGRRENWLENTPSNRPPVGIEILTVRGRCAGLMEVLITQGRLRREAAEFIITHLPKPALRKLAGPHIKKDIVWRTVAGWRENVTGSAGDGADVEAYRSQIAHSVEWTDEKIRDALRLLASFV